VVKIAYAAYTNRLWIVLSLKPCLFFDPEISRVSARPPLLEASCTSAGDCSGPSHRAQWIPETTKVIHGNLSHSQHDDHAMSWGWKLVWKNISSKKVWFSGSIFFFVYIYVSLGNGWKWCHNHRPNKWWSCTSFNTKVGSHQLSPVILDTFNLNLRQIPIILSRQQNGHHMPSWSAETNCCSKDHWPSQEPKLIIGCTYHIYI
jgi:hypothetical protein